jgi:hypothetical protein
VQEVKLKYKVLKSTMLPTGWTARTVIYGLLGMVCFLAVIRLSEFSSGSTQTGLAPRTRPDTVPPSQEPTPRPSWAPTFMSPNWEMSTYVWVFGIAQQCDIGADSPLVLYRGFWEFDVNVHLSSGDIVWVWSPKVIKFVEQALPLIHSPFVLVISGEDNTFPKNVLSTAQLDQLVKSSNVIHIYAQNFDSRNVSHDARKKITHIPIGYDFQIPGYKSSPPTIPNVTEQVKMLDGIIGSMPDRSKRKLRIFEDFHHSNWMRNGCFKRYLEFDGQDRDTIFQAINATGLVDYSSRRQNRLETFIEKTQYVFTVSPPGNGIDCHRTWEDLLMGCIVIVMETGMDAMYEGLPVVVVKNWTEEVTYANLVLWEKRFRNMPFESYRHRLTNRYWLNLMATKAAPSKKLP